MARHSLNASIFLIRLHFDHMMMIRVRSSCNSRGIGKLDSNGESRENRRLVIISIRPSFNMSSVSWYTWYLLLYICGYIGMRAINKERTETCACEGNTGVKLRRKDCRMGRPSHQNASNKRQKRQNLPS